MIMATDISVLAIAEQWPFLPTLERFGLAIAIGVFVGIEQEYSGNLGTRTFGLIAILGCLAGVARSPFIWIASPIFLLVLTFINWRRLSAHDDEADALFAKRTGIKDSHGRYGTPSHGPYRLTSDLQKMLGEL
jgi:hypothetical protein